MVQDPARDKNGCSQLIEIHEKSLVWIPRLEEVDRHVIEDS